MKESPQNQPESDFDKLCKRQYLLNRWLSHCEHKKYVELSKFHEIITKANAEGVEAVLPNQEIYIKIQLEIEKIQAELSKVQEQINKAIDKN